MSIRNYHIPEQLWDIRNGNIPFQQFHAGRRFLTAGPSSIQLPWTASALRSLKRGASVDALQKRPRPEGFKKTLETVIARMKIPIGGIFGFIAS